MTPQIVDIKTLRSILSDENGMLEKRWKDLPHFHIGKGQNLKSARFDVNDVLFYLKSVGDNYECVAGQENGEVEVQVRIPGRAQRAKGLCNKTRSSGGRVKRQKKTTGPDTGNSEILSLFKRSGGKVPN